MRVLVACEFSGVVRDAFRRRGHDAWSCDLLESEADPVHHIRGDVRNVISHPERWDLLIAHPPCTYLCNSGVRWLYERKNRWEQMQIAADFVRELLDAAVPKIALEQPLPHKYAVARFGRSYDQLVQPWMFGVDETKAVCLWLKGLPNLEATVDLAEARQRKHKARVHRASPGPDRWKERSRFWPEVADVMAEQWGAS